jgi:hypothetical protein
MRHAVIVLLAATLWTPRLMAQGSPFVPLDDPVLPLFEQLVGRGVVDDPSPFERPFTRADGVAALVAPRRPPSASDAALIRRVLAAWRPEDSANRWDLAVRVGAEGFTSPRRDPLRPEGPGGVRLLADASAHLTIGEVVLATRPTADQRVTLDPDWPGTRASPDLTCCRWRFPEAYLRWTPGPLAFFYGRVARDWGPAPGLFDGTVMSDVAYPRDAIGLSVRSRSFRLSALLTDLRTVHLADDDIQRWHFVTQATLRVSSALTVHASQAVVAEGPARELDGPLRNPLLLLPLANQFGQGDADNNVMIAIGARWRADDRLTLEGELLVDDFIQSNRDQFPDRWAMTLAASGPLADRFAWRAGYTRASSLAFRASDPLESYTEQGVGLGRGWAGGDRAVAQLATPVAGGWLVTLEAAVARQGESRLDQPIDRTQPIPGIFIGTIERTSRLAIKASGRAGPLDASADVGLHRIANWHHQAGVSRSEVQARVTAQLRLGTRGVLP